MSTHWIIAATTIIWLIICAILDARFGEVPNWLTIPVMFIGIIYAIFIGWERVGLVAIAFVALIILFYLGSMGGADVKVLTALAGLWPAAMIAAFITQGLWGIVVIIKNGRGSEFRAIPSYALGALLSALLLI